MNFFDSIKLDIHPFKSEKVFCDIFDSEMKIIGYIPVPSDDEERIRAKEYISKYGININAKIVLTNSRIRFVESEFSLPFYTLVSKSIQREYMLCLNRRVLPWEMLDVGLIKFYSNPSVIDANNIIKKLNKHNYTNCRVDEEGRLVYMPSESVVELSRYYEDPYNKEVYLHRVIFCEDFMCICAYTNSVTGDFSYGVFNPRNLFLVNPPKTKQKND